MHASFAEKAWENIHKVETFKVDSIVRDCAAFLHDHALNTKLAGGDLIATDGVYHKPCILRLQKQADEAQKQNVHEEGDRTCFQYG